MNSYGYALEIEQILCGIFECERHGFGSMVNSDIIRNIPIMAIFSGLSYIYANADEIKKKSIEDYISDNLFYAEMSIDELLSFETSSKNIDGMTIDIGYSNGKDAIESIVNEFRALC